MTQHEITLPLDDVAELREAAEQVMQVETFATEQMAGRQVLRLHGKLLLDPQAAYRQVAPLFRARNYTALLDEDPLGARLTALPGLIAGGKSRLWLALLLFGLTIISTMLTGGLNDESGIPINPGLLFLDPSVKLFFSFGLGLAFSAAMLSILLAHEMGHYLVARRLNVAVSFPFFIPLPLSPLGTMGAFIQLKEPPPDRRAVLAIGIAGPLAGLVVALPVLILGLSLSEVRPFVPSPESFTEGNSILYALMKIALFGRFLPGGGEDVFLHPVALAGWAGLLVTGLNLIPAGQLDGGHILYSLVGRRIARYISMTIAAILVVMGFFWSGWWLWAVLITVLGQQSAPVLNDLTPLTSRLRLLAVLGLVVFVLVFTPIPITIGQ